jgi:hypothetical protein
MLMRITRGIRASGDLSDAAVRPNHSDIPWSGFGRAISSPEALRSPAATRHRDSFRASTGACYSFHWLCLRGVQAFVRRSRATTPSIWLSRHTKMCRRVAGLQAGGAFSPQL